MLCSEFSYIEWRRGLQLAEEHQGVVTAVMVAPAEGLVPQKGGDEQVLNEELQSRHGLAMNPACSFEYAISFVVI